MASLGNLHFNIGFDSDPKQIEEIKKKVLAQLEDLEVKFNMNIGFSKEDLAKQVNEALSKEHKLNVTVDKADVEKSVNDAISGGKTSTSDISQETEAVKNQAIAYKELKGAVNSIIGTRAQNIRRLVEEKNTLASVQSQLKLLEKQQQMGVVLNKDQIRQKATLINREFEHKQAIAELNQLIRSDVKLTQAASTSMDEMSQELSRLRVAYRGLSEDMRQSPFGRDLQQQITNVDQRIKAMDASIGNHQRNVGNYKSGWNGLQHQLMQLAREMPAAAYGMNVFFAAISNNLPMFGDEVKKAQAEYKALVTAQKQGLMLNQKAIPVWKQLAKGILSGQMAFTVIVTLLTFYGAKIVDWIFQTKSATKAHDEFIKSIKSGNSEYGEAIKEITRLEGILSNVDGKYITAKDALDEYNESIGKNIGQTDDLGTAIQTLMDKKDEYLQVMFQMAMANSFLAEMQKKASEAAAIRADRDVNFIDKVAESFRAASNYQTARPTDGASWDEFVLGKREERAKTAEEAGLELAKSYMDAIRKGYDMAADAGIDLLPDSDKSGSKGKDPMQERLKNLNEAYSRYKELAALIGKEKAIPIIQDMFMPDFDPDKFRDQIQSIYDDIQNSAEIRGEAGSILFGFDKEQITGGLKDTEVYIKKTIASWDLFSELFKESGDYNFSVNAAFGGNVAYKDVLDQLKKNIEYELEKLGGIVSFDDLIKMPNSQINSSFGASMSSLVKAYQEQNKKITDESVKNLAKLLSNQRNYENKRKEIIAKSEEEARALRTAGYEKEAQEREKMGTQEVASLDFEQFKDSDLWSKTFEDLDRLSTSTINDVIAKLEEFKNTAGRDLPIRDFKELMNTLKKMRGEVESRNPFKTLIQGFRQLSKAKKGSEEAADAIDKIKTAFSDADPYIQSFASAFGSLSQMFDSLGDEQLSKTMSNAQDALSSISNIGQGFAKGGIVGGIGAAIGEAASWVSKLANAHDEILDKAIEKSIQQAERLKNTYENIERSLRRSLGENSVILGNIENPYADRIKEEEKNLAEWEYLLSQFKSQGKPEWMSISQYTNTIKQYNKRIDESKKSLEELRRLSNSFSVESNLFEYQRKLIEQEIEELKKQRDAEMQKNKPDPSTLSRLDAEILEAEDRLAYFAEDLANTLYGINLKDWASELGDTLYNAWKQGEDGAEAFKKKSAEIIGDVMNEMLKISILEPMMKDVRDALFGKDGKSGYFGDDYALDDSEMKNLASILMEGEKKSDAYYKALDGLNDYMEKNYGVSLKDKSESDGGGLSAGIKGITEDTASLLASYANSIRADGFARNEMLRRLIEEQVPQMNVYALTQINELRAIKYNTDRNANSAEEIMDLLRSVASGTKTFHIK